MKLIVGLGNPGSAYAATRHNAGKSFVAALGERLSAGPFALKKRYKASISQLSWGGQKVALAWPETFMNLSGEAVKLLTAGYGSRPETDLLVVVDDLDLPFGKVRFRSEGSDGGHNGLKSIQAHLGTRSFARIKIGIGRPLLRAESDRLGEETIEDYVLSPFKNSEQEALGKVFAGLIEGCQFWTQGLTPRASNSINSLKIII